MQSLRKTQSLFLKDFSKLKTQKFDVDIGGNVLNLILGQIFFKTNMKKLSFFFTLLGINVRTLNSKGTTVFTDIFSMGSANLGLPKVCGHFCAQTCAHVSAHFTQLFTHLP